MSTESLPTLIAYRAGDCVESELNVDQVISEEELPLPMLTWLLQRMSVRLTRAPPGDHLPPPGGCIGARLDVGIVDEEDAEDYHR